MAALLCQGNLQYWPKAPAALIELLRMRKRVITAATIMNRQQQAIDICSKKPHTHTSRRSKQLPCCWKSLTQPCGESAWISCCLQRLSISCFPGSGTRSDAAGERDCVHCAPSLCRGRKQLLLQHAGSRSTSRCATAGRGPRLIAANDQRKMAALWRKSTTETTKRNSQGHKASLRREPVTLRHTPPCHPQAILFGPSVKNK